MFEFCSWLWVISDIFHQLAFLVRRDSGSIGWIQIQMNWMEKLIFLISISFWVCYFNFISILCLILRLILKFLFSQFYFQFYSTVLTLVSSRGSWAGSWGFPPVVVLWSCMSLQRAPHRRCCEVYLNSSYLRFTRDSFLPASSPLTHALIMIVSVIIIFASAWYSLPKESLVNTALYRTEPLCESVVI